MRRAAFVASMLTNGSDAAGANHAYSACALP